MADKPILFSGPMVRALLAGTKTQTRRLCTLPEPSAPIIDMVKVATDAKSGRAVFEMKDVLSQLVTIREGKHFLTPHFSPRIAVGDRLWVREAWTLHDRAADVGTVAYQATMKSHGWTETIEQFPRELTLATRVQPVQRGWRPSIHMPRWASRLTLTVINVRVERLQDISEEDAIAEGIEATHVPVDKWKNYQPKAFAGVGFLSARNSYMTLWNSINGPGSWEANPWVAAYTFTVERGNIDQLARAA